MTCPPAGHDVRVMAAEKVAPVKYGDDMDAPESQEGALFQVVIVKNGGMEGTE